jgi:hypothetical protein
MRVVGIASYTKDLAPLERIMRNAMVFPLYDGGNQGVRRRQLHEMLRHPQLRPDGGSSRRYVSVSVKRLPVRSAGDGESGELVAAVDSGPCTGRPGGDLDVVALADERVSNGTPLPADIYAAAAGPR